MTPDRRLKAERLEALLPRVMRALYKVDPEDPLVELTAAQIRTLRVLQGGSRSASHIGEELGLSTSAITQMANRLEGLGFVERSEDPGDRRVKQLGLTPYGLAVLEARRLKRVLQAENALSRLPEDRINDVIVALEDLMRACLSVGGDEGAPQLVTIAELEQRLPSASSPAH